MLKNENTKFMVVRFDGPDADEQWRESRKAGIGGSDVATILGLNRFKSPYTLWAEKTGLVEPEDISGKEAVQMGNELEADVRNMFASRHPDYRVQVCNAHLTSVERPWAQASLDGLIYDTKTKRYGVLEIKTGGSESVWREGAPLWYQTQCFHYLSVTGYDFVCIAVLVGDHGLHYHEFRYDRSDPSVAEDMRTIDGMVDSFWNENVLGNVAPELMVGTPDEGKTLNETRGEDGGEWRASTGDESELMTAYQRAAAKEAEFKKKKDALANSIKKAIGTDHGIIGDGFKASWSTYERQGVDSKALKAQFPDVWERVKKVSRASKLTVTETKE